MATPVKHYNTLRDMLIAAGVGHFSAPLAIQFMSFLPRTCDPRAQGVLILVQGLQRLLNKGGKGPVKLKVRGTMTDETVDALMVYAGPRWYDKSWQQLYTEVLSGNPWEGWKRRDRFYEPPQLIAGTASLSGTLETVTDFFTSPVGLIATGLVGLVVYSQHKARSAR